MCSQSQQHQSCDDATATTAQLRIHTRPFVCTHTHTLAHTARIHLTTEIYTIGSVWMWKPMKQTPHCKWDSCKYSVCAVQNVFNNFDIYFMERIRQMMHAATMYVYDSWKMWSNQTPADCHMKILLVFFSSLHLACDSNKQMFKSQRQKPCRLSTVFHDEVHSHAVTLHSQTHIFCVNRISNSNFDENNYIWCFILKVNSAQNVAGRVNENMNSYRTQNWWQKTLCCRRTNLF